MPSREAPPSIESLARLFEKNNYVADNSILTTVFLALSLKKPLLIEGDAGCGKTELAKVLASALGADLIRLQCYEGLDANSTIYEWDYMRQLLKIKMEEAKASERNMESEIFSERYLLKRPLMKAVLHTGSAPPVLLIDEIDRADEEFEGFLLEFLGEFQITVPELGTFRAERPPVVVITSNRTRELGDGLRRRCLYLYLTYPSLEKELKIVRMKVPGISEKLTRQMINVVNRLRAMESLQKKPGVSETLDWANSLLALGKTELDRPTFEQTLGCVVKGSDELLQLKNENLEKLVGQE